MDASQKTVSDAEFNRLWEITKEINENIRHYNEHQTKYRTLASQWLIAAMVGIGFLFDANTGLPFSNHILILLICLISALGILQLWRMDISSFFSAGAAIEKENPSLPQIKSKIYELVPHKNAGQNLFYFYYFIIALFLLLALLILVHLPKPEFALNFIRAGWVDNIYVLIYFILLGFLFKYMWYMSSSNSKNKKSKLQEQNQKK
jgi:hypothetical protein